MKKIILGLIAAGAVAFGWDIKQVANMQFCYHARVDFSACSFADTFMNEVYFYFDWFGKAKLLKKEADKNPEAKAKLEDMKKEADAMEKRFKKGLRKLCARWEITSYAGRQFIENQVTMLFGDEVTPIVSAEDMRSFCDK